MVHFGHYIFANRIPEWESHYIGYKSLKKRINEYASRASTASSEEREAIINSFAQLLDSQVERIVLFLIKKQGLLAERLLVLAEKQQSALSSIQADMEAATSYQLIEEYREVGQELLKLLNFVEINTTGLRKILKKFDKRVGFRFREQYLASRINHPYSQLQQVFKQVGIGALMGTIAQNLVELTGKSHRRSYFSLFGVSSIPSKVMEQEPIIKALEGAVHKLTKEVTFMSFVANDLLLPEPDHALEIPDERELHFMSVQLNLWNTFLYMVNYYIIIPTTDDYAETLHVPGTMNGVIIGAMPLAALVSAVVYSWWSNFSYKSPLFTSSLLLIGGNLLYALALPFNSFWFLVLGRALSGLGGARAINRRYLMDHVPIKHLTNVSASFVIASSLGMAAGPALASLLIKLDFRIFNAPVNQYTAPGWVMMVLWTVYMLVALFAFKEPKRLNISHDTGNQVNVLVDDGSDSGSGISDPLLRDGETPGKVKDSAGGILDIFKALNTPVQILLMVYFMLKFAVEMLVSESGIISEFYFHWTSSQVGYFLGALGLAVLPICAVVANYISNLFADRVVIFWTEILIALGVIGNICYYPLFKYSTVQYVGSAIIIFLSTNVLEGVNMSLLSKVMPSRLSRGVFNCGFLSTEAGTLARALSDGLISLGGKAGMDYLLLVTMIPTLVLVLATIAWTWIGYYTLY